MAGVEFPKEVLGRALRCSWVGPRALGRMSLLATGGLRKRTMYRGTSPIRQRTPLGPYRRPMPRVLGGGYAYGRVLRGWAFSCGRGTSVVSCGSAVPCQACESQDKYELI